MRAIVSRIAETKVAINTHNLIVMLLGAAAFCAPMGANGIALHTGVGSISLFRLIFAIIILVIAIDSLLNGIGFKRVYNGKNKLSVLYMIFWWVAAMASILWSVDTGGFIMVMFFLTEALILSLVIVEYADKDDILFLMHSLNAGLLLQALLGLFEIFTGNYHYLQEASIRSYKIMHFPVAMMGNTNDFATGMFVGIWITLYFLFMESFMITKRYMMKYIMYTSMLALYSIVLLYCDSRAVIMGLVIGIIVIFVLRKGILVILASCALFLYLVFSRGLVQKIMKAFINAIIVFSQNRSLIIRTNLARSGLAFLYDSFGIGVGNGQIEYAMRNYAEYKLFDTENMHNWWGEIIISYGLIVFMILCVVYIKMIYDFYKEYVCEEKNRKQGMKSLIMVGALVGSSMALNSSSSNMHNEFVWFAISICIGLQGCLKGASREYES